MSKSLEEKWREVKYFYEQCGYKHPVSKSPIKFAVRPSDSQIQFLFDAMQKFKLTTKDYFFKEPFLLRRMESEYTKRTGKKSED